MKGLSSYSGFLAGTALATALAMGGSVRADLLVTAPARTPISGLPKSLDSSAIAVNPTSSVSLDFVSQGSPFIPSQSKEVNAPQRLVFQLLSVAVIPTGSLYNWTTVPTPVPPPPTTSSSPTAPSPPTSVPPTGSPPDPTPPSGTPTLQTPEPSSLLLAGLGISFVGWRGCRSRKQNKASS